MGTHAIARLTFAIAAVAMLCATSALAAPGNFIINTNFTGGTVDQRAAYNAAANDWTALFSGPEGKNVTLTVNLTFGSLALGNGGKTSTFTVDANKLPKSVNMTLSTNTDMFWDSTLGTSNDIPADKKDGFTVARHELGHAIGFSHNPDGYELWDAAITDNMFNKGGVTATLAGGTGDANGQSHLDVTAHPGDLMNLTVGLGNRRSISTLDRDMLVATFAYSIPEPASISILCIAGIRALARRGRRAA